VLKTKANICTEDLCPTESAKIACGRRHFDALDQAVAFKAVDDFNEFVESV
jgi:type III restriction enzyme